METRNLRKERTGVVISNKMEKSIVIAGTHGKTTTSALASWFLETGGLDPGFMVGGLCRNFNGNFRDGQGPCFVIEGDEASKIFSKQELAQELEAEEAAKILEESDLEFTVATTFKDAADKVVDVLN